MIDIIKLLRENEEITDYKVNGVNSSTYENFFVKDKLETVRVTETEDCVVTVYVDGDGVKGDSSFSVYSSMDENTVKQKISAAAKRAKLVKNAPYSIPLGDKTEVAIASNFTKYEPSELAEKIFYAVKQADSYANGSINALEIFIYKEVIWVKNSRGVDKTQTRYRAMIEAIPTWTENGESVELYEAYHFTDFNAEEITVEIDGKMREVRDRKLALKIPPQTIHVLLPYQEIGRMFDEITDSFNFATVYAHANPYKKGDDLQPERTGDVIDLTMCHEIKGGRFSSVFDDDGVTLKDKKVIENGKVVGYYGSNRFGSYLGEEITGNLKCIRLSTGSMNIPASPYLECVSLSGIQVDLYNDYIGGEIRLAYLVDGESKIPVTGISMSGKLSEVLNGIEFSKDEIEKDYYRGPIKAVLKNMTIS